ncbi:MAG TPA: hypothetical protein VGL63_07245 [Streptosporangiaceae bacterium]|jgi:putative hydrolase of the HAD superfamily
MSWVMFDFGGVICTPQPEEDLAALAGTARVSVAELWDAYWPARPAYDAGDLTSMTYWQGVAGQFGRTFRLHGGTGRSCRNDRSARTVIS